MSANLYDPVNKELIPYAGTVKDNTFIGSTEQWESLTEEERSVYDTVNIVDDYGEVSEIEIYYVESLPSAGINDAIYGLVDFNTVSKTAADGFLDNDSVFTKNTISGGYAYTADGILVSPDGVIYYEFDMLRYDGTKFILSCVGEEETFDVALGSTFYYKTVGDIKYYGGVALDQTLHPIDCKTVLKQTLTAGGTSVTFTDLPNSSSKMVSFATSNGAVPSAVNTATAGSATLTFSAQSVDITVFCKIEEI